MRRPRRITRRRFLTQTGLSALAGGVAGLGCRSRPAPSASPPPSAAPPATPASPAIVTAAGRRPTLPYGVMSGDVSAGSAVLWAACDRPARMLIELDTSDRFPNPRRLVGPAALADSGYAAKLAVRDLPDEQDLFYRVTFQDLGDLKTLSQPTVGHLRSPPRSRRSVRFLWSGDTCGQGFGINPDWGGLRIYEPMRTRQPDFFVHCGDTIYADGPIAAEVPLADGGVWKNLTLEGKHKVAETLDEFRACYRYNLLDSHLRAFNAEVPMFAQWDDHETTNNWYPQERLPAGGPYQVERAALLAARAKRAFIEWMPIRTSPEAPEQLYRQYSYGPLLDLFIIDLRTYRGRNSANQQAAAGPDTAIFGAEQRAWLEQALLGSRARWRVIASDMPLGLVIADGEHFEGVAQGDGPARGREHELSQLLQFIDDHDIDNVVWLTADVHYTAAHHYHPNRARFQRFRPFWEFVSGPLHAGTFGPNQLDDTFGPAVKFQKAPAPGQANLPPSAGLQFFGEVNIDGADDSMTVTLRDLTGASLYEVTLAPAG